MERSQGHQDLVFICDALMALGSKVHAVPSRKRSDEATAFMAVL
jgi:hypothetical protein